MDGDCAFALSVKVRSIRDSKRNNKFYASSVPYMEHYLYICSVIDEEIMLRPGFKVIMSAEVDAFLGTLQEDARAKIIYNVDKVANGYMDKDLFKKLENTDIWEFRTLFKGIQYRLLAFWDTDAETLVVATHGFIKKTQKTPRKEINKAEAIRKLYFETKK